MKKRWLAIFLTLAMCLSLLPIMSVAEETADAETPQLWCIDLDDDEDFFFEDAESDFTPFAEVEFLPSQGHIYGLYYGTEDSKAPVIAVDSNDEGVIVVQKLDGKNNEKHFYQLNGVGCGSATLTCATQTEGNITVEIEVDIPVGGGWYTAQPRSQGTYIAGSFLYDSNDPSPLWVMREEGFSDAEYGEKVFTLVISGLPESNLEIELDEDARVYRQDGTFDIQVEIPAKIKMESNGAWFKLYADFNEGQGERLASNLKVYPVETDEPSGDENQMPDYALFSQPDYDAQYLLESINLLALEDNAVWLIHKEGFSAEVIEETTVEWLCTYSDNYCPETNPVVTPVARGDGKYDIKITLPVADASCQLQVTGPDMDEFWWVEINGTSVQIGDYLIGYGEMNGEGVNSYLTINPNEYRHNTNSESTSDARSALGAWEIYAGTPTDQEDVYTPADNVAIQINKVWVDVIKGDANLFSWSEAVEPLVTELTTFDGNICGRLYRLNAKEGLGVIYSNITVTINGESTTHTIASVMAVKQVASNESERPVNDTVEKLNEYLQKLKEDDSGAEEDAHYEIYLPAITYTGDIVVPAFKNGTLFIYGAGGQKTILEGCITMEEGANIHRVYDISFRATKEHDDYAITGGSGTIVDCNFYGYDVAIKSGRNYIRVAGNCTFMNNGIGYLHDSTGNYENGYGSASFEECVFINNDTAISLRNWGESDPDTFEFRVYNSDFVNNRVDFDVTAPGNFYFFGNYFGHFRDGVHSLDEVDALDDIQYQKPHVSSGKDTTVFTNPRRVSPYNILDGRRDTTLRVDNGRKTVDDVAINKNYIPNSETDELVMDTALLSEEVTASGEAISLSIINDDEEVQATWTIN